jgi:MFS family permease
VLIPIEGNVTTYAVSFLLGFFASGQAAGYGAFLAELFPSEMRGAGQGLAYNVGRGLAALGPGFIGMTSASIGLGNSILIVGFCACTLAILCVWLLPETRGKVIVEPEVGAERRQPVGATT